MSRPVREFDTKLCLKDPRKPVRQLEKYRSSLMGNLCLVTSGGYGGLYELSSPSRWRHTTGLEGDSELLSEIHRPTKPHGAVA
jgi:hypothetical protein